jgi:hypothetical protein
VDCSGATPACSELNAPTSEQTVQKQSLLGGLAIRRATTVKLWRLAQHDRLVSNFPLVAIENENLTSPIQLTNEECPFTRVLTRVYLHRVVDTHLHARCRPLKHRTGERTSSWACTRVGGSEVGIATWISSALRATRTSDTTARRGIDTSLPTTRSTVGSYRKEWNPQVQCPTHSFRSDLPSMLAISTSLRLSSTVVPY